MVTLMQLAIGFFIVLFPEQTMMIAGKSFITEDNPVAVLGILIIGNLLQVHVNDERRLSWGRPADE